MKTGIDFTTCTYRVSLRFPLTLPLYSQTDIYLIFFSAIHYIYLKSEHWIKALFYVII